MNVRPPLSKWLIGFILMHAIIPCLLSQSQKSSMSESPFSRAEIRMDRFGSTPVDIRFSQGRHIPLTDFFAEYKRTLGLSDDVGFRLFNSISDRIGQTHHRYKQYYKGIEVAHVQCVLHEFGGLVFHMHGNTVHGLNLSVVPAMPEAEALAYALDNIDAESYMWEDRLNEAFIKREQDDPDATFYPHGKLMLSSGRKEMVAEHFRLVYRFDIYAERPYGRYDVDVDASTGEVILINSRIHARDVQGEGLSLYNGIVPITVSDADYPQQPVYPPNWHLDDWNAYGSEGQSWWAANPDLGNQGGYGNLWYDVLDTDPIEIRGNDARLVFYHRYNIQTPGTINGWDGFDGMNVRVSQDDGATWHVLTDPTPAYTCESLVSFGYYGGEDQGIPGWAGQLDEWTEVTFDLTAFTGQTIRLRFAFASDAAQSAEDGASDLYGWQIDDILVTSEEGNLFWNDGATNGMTPGSNRREVTEIEGNYRLREQTRGQGIFTYDLHGDTRYSTAIDFVDDDSSFTNPDAQGGVSAHWGAEAFYDYFQVKFQRNSYDDLGARLLSYLHAGEFGTVSGAWWDGTRVTYRDVSGICVATLDIVGHEFTHAITNYYVDLKYENDTGALNESFSDIFGAAIEFYKECENGDWIIGEDLGCVQSLENPNAGNHPDTYRGDFWVPATSDPTPDNDFGGVHTNSGVQNHWFYLLCEGGTGVNDNGHTYSVSGIDMDEAAQIVYRHQTIYYLPNSTYFDAGRHATQAAFDLFGENSAQHHSVLDAWYAVGVYVEPKTECPDSICFSSTEVGVPDTSAIVITNIGLDTLTVDSVAVSGTQFRILDTLVFPYALGFEDSITIRVAYVPGDQDPKTVSLMIWSSDPRFPLKTAILQGTVQTGVQRIADGGRLLPFYLYQNYPNPFNPNTVIQYDLPDPSKVTLTIYNVLGEEIRTLVDEYQTAGTYSIVWDGKNHLGESVYSGVYMVHLSAGRYESSRKMLLLK